MSLHRENVSWQNEQGAWSIGFYSFTGHWEPNDDPSDYDQDWDVDYDHDTFWWLSTGHPDADAAYAAFVKEESNPGDSWILRWTPEHYDEIARLEAIAAAHPARLTAAAAAQEAEWAAIFAQWERRAA
nr:hypothetical protein KPHV_28900 [Kitasatospora purpeofusca]